MGVPRSLREANPITAKTDYAINAVRTRTVDAPHQFDTGYYRRRRGNPKVTERA